MTVNLIWSQTFNGIMGRNGQKPWYVPEELDRLRELVKGKAVIMGRATFESLQPSHPYEESEIIVLSRTRNYEAAGAEVAASVDRALLLVPRKQGDIWVVGGRHTLESFWDRADQLIITDLDFYENGDTDAPWVTAEWSEDSVEPSDGKMKISVMGLGYRFRTMKRTKNAGDLWFEDSPLL